MRDVGQLPDPFHSKSKSMEKQGIEPWTSTMLKLRYTT